MPGLDIHQGRLTRLGKHRAGKAYSNVKRLADIDVSVLEEMVTASVEHARRPIRERQERAMSRVMHFEIHASDPQRLADFYSGLLGWTFGSGARRTTG